MIGRSLRVILRSLRGRIVLAALLWSVGLLTLLDVLSKVITKAASKNFPGMGPIDKLLISMAGTACLIAALLIVAGALRRLDAVRMRVIALRGREGSRLTSPGLTEIEPLVRDMNELLDHRERVSRRALATAGDLAHGLKTPLAILAQEVRRLDGSGQHESAATLAEQIERMRRQIDYQLARASASGAAYRSSVRLVPIAERVASALRRLYASRSLDVSVEVPDTIAVRCATEDLEEMLGNVLDNACKWARSSIAIDACLHDGSVLIAVNDDGPGIEPFMREHVLRRGVRADETAPGSGLGLSIVQDLADLYGGSISLGTSPLGGLSARLQLPGA